MDDPFGPVAPSRVERGLAFWDATDLPATEARLRDMVARRDLGISGDGHGVLGRVGSIDQLLVRAIFEQGRNEDSLNALRGVLEMGCPYWLLQIRFLAEGRLASMIGVPDLALDRFQRSLDIPLNGLPDVDYLLRSLYEIATLDTCWLSDVPNRTDWARLALDLGERLGPHRGRWFSAAIREQLELVAREGTTPQD
jgi:hypothetical protein